MTFNEKIDKYMEENKIESIKQLALASDIPYTTLIDFYNKQSADNSRLSTIRKLSKFMGCTMDYLSFDEISDFNCYLKNNDIEGTVIEDIEQKHFSDNKNIFAKNLKYYMDMHDIDRNDICKILDIPYTTLSDWLNAKKYPRIDKIEIMANYFNIQKSDLIENKEEFNELDQLLFSKAKELNDDEKRAIIQVMNAIHKEIDKELDN